MPEPNHVFGDFSKRVAVMQPYLFPYFPYVQLLACVDIFIIFDTAQFISRGWANRNAINLNGNRHSFALPVEKHARSAPFTDIRFANNFDADLCRIRTTLDHATRMGDFRSASQALIDKTFPAPSNAQTPFILAFERMAGALMQYIGFETKMLRASQFSPRSETSAQDYIMRLVREAGGNHYINPIGGTALYESGSFVQQGLSLSFLKTMPKADDGEKARSHLDLDLSILDSLAYHSPEDILHRLRDFILIDETGRQIFGN